MVLHVLASAFMVPVQFAMAKVQDFPTWITWIFVAASFYGMVMAFSWPFIISMRFYPNFVMDYIENSFKTWSYNIQDDIGINTGEKLDIGLQLVDLTNKYDESLGPTISISFTFDIILAIVSSYSCTSIAFKIGDANHLNYCYSAFNLLAGAAHVAGLIWTYERGHKLHKTIQKSRIALEDACYKR